MSVYSAAIIADAPKGYWRLGEASGTSAADQMGTPAAGTYTGTFTLGAAGAISADADTAVDLPGGATQGEVVVGTPAKLNGLTSWSLECWVKLDTSSGGSAFITRDLSTGVRFEMGVGSDLASTDPLAQRLMGGFYNGNWRLVRDTVDLPLTAWHHVVLTFDGPTKVLKLYRAGAQVATLTSPDSPPTTDTTIRFGRRHDLSGAAPNKWYMDGKLDEVAIYDFALSAAQVANHYALGSPPSGVTASGSTSLTLTEQIDSQGLGAIASTSLTLTQTMLQGLQYAADTALELRQSIGNTWIGRQVATAFRILTGDVGPTTIELRGDVDFIIATPAGTSPANEPVPTSADDDAGPEDTLSGFGATLVESDGYHGGYFT